MTMSSAPDIGASWYSIPQAGDELGQGDQLFGFPLLYVARDENNRPIAFEAIADLIILTQSCDLIHSKVSTILTALTASLSDWIVENPNDLERLEAIRQGFDASLYVVPSWPEGPYEQLRYDRIVDFGAIYSVATEDIASASGARRVALASPAREHFGQAVARSFMRVGLPIDIPSFKLNRLGSEKQTLAELPFHDNSDLAGTQRFTLARPLAVTLHTRERASIHETWYRMTTIEQPAVEGAGATPEQATRSLARQIIRRMLEGDARWAWLRDAITLS